MDPDFDATLTWNQVVTIYLLTYSVTVAIYLFLGVAFTVNYIKNQTLASKIPVFRIIGFFILLNLITSALDVAYVVSLILDLDSQWLLLLASGLSDYICVAFIYILLTLLCKGMCITRGSLSPAEKQSGILLGISMMILEIVLVGQRMYSIILLFVYLLLLRLFSSQIDIQMSQLTNQILAASVTIF